MRDRRELLAQIRRGEVSPQEGYRRLQAKDAYAIVGMACRFPGADDLDEFWALLRGGVDAVTEIPGDRWPLAGFYDPDPAAPGRSYSRWGGFVREVRRFDAGLFELSPAEAAVLDPQQRLFLEVALTAMEHAGYGRLGAEVEAGVFVGARMSSYTTELHVGSPAARELGRAAILGHSQNYIAAWVADRLDLRGPALVVDTACSSSLVAAHLACQSLARGECSVALVGGVDLLLSPASHLFLSRARVLSPTGRCRTFDRAADGYVPGEGAGAVVLRRLADAVRDGDTIYAVILGSAVNNDGRTMGITTPNFAAQRAVIRRALATAGVGPETLTYVEAHGTGTTIGDPIEVRALADVFADCEDRGFCALGSVKSNIGHLHSAAGIASLIKVALALHHAEIPPTLHCREPNPRFEFARSPLSPNLSLKTWSPRHGVRRAGISAFGFGGTNCHMIVEAAPAARPLPASPREPRPLVLSAHSAPALRALTGAVAEALAKVDPADAAFTLHAGRTLHSHRVAVTGAGTEELAAGLRAAIEDPARTATVSRRRPPGVVFMFPGQGAQSPGMCRELYARFPSFRAAFDRCAALVGDRLGAPLAELVFASGAREALVRTELAQPAMFAVEYAAASLWQAWGVTPAAVVGHSLGEYVAACVAGVVSLEEAVALVVARGQRMAALPEPGTMVAVLAAAAEVEPLVAGYPDEVAIAALNGPKNTVIAGRASRVAEIVAQASARGIGCVPLRVSHAFHSPLLRPMVADFAAALGRCTFAAPRVPLYANLTGAPLTRAPDVDHWIQHLLAPVCFADAARALHADGYRHFVEVGPGETLVRLLAGAVGGDPEVTLYRTWRAGHGLEDIAKSAAEMSLRGIPVDLASYEERRRRRIALPTHPLAGERLPVTAAEYARWSATGTASEPVMSAATEGTPAAGSATSGTASEAGAGASDSGTSAAGGEAVAGASGSVTRAERGGAAVGVGASGSATASDRGAGTGASDSARLMAGSVAAGGGAFAGEVVERTEPRVEVEGRPGEARGLPDAASAVLGPDDPRVADHRVFGRPVLAGAAQWLLALAAAPAATGLRQVTTLRPLFVTGRREVEVEVRGDRFAIRSRAPGEAGWTVHTAGGLSRAQDERPPVIDLQAARAACPEVAPVEALYADLARRGLDCGPSFRAVQEIHRGSGRVLARLRTAGEGWDPGALDGALQALAALIRGEAEGLRVPFVLEALRLWAAPPAELFALGTIEAGTEDAETVRCQVQLVDAAGQPLASVGPLWLKRVAPSLLADAAGGKVAEGTGVAIGASSEVAEETGSEGGEAGFFAPRWTPAEPSAAPWRAAGRWLVLAEGEASTGLARAIAAAGGEAVVVRPASGFVAEGESRFGVRPDAEDDWAALSRALGEAKLAGVIHAWLVGQVMPEAEELGRGVFALAGVARAFAGKLAQEAGRLILVTRAAQPVGGGAAEVVPARAAALGLARTWAREHGWGLDGFDLEAGEEDVGPVVAHLGAAEAREWARRGGRWLAREVAALELPRRASWPSAEAVAVLTGGGGGLGRALAEELARRGVRRIALIGRRTPSLAPLRASGARVVAVQADVSDATQLGAALAEIRRELGPITDVFHLAGVLDDDWLRARSRAAMTAVLRPKIAGAHNLAALTAADPVRRFVLFASLAGVRGNLRQGDYAAANAYLDAWAHERRARGLPAISVDWSLWGEAGVGARAELRSIAAREGVEPLTTAAALAALGRVLAAEPAQVVVGALDPARVFAPPRATAPARKSAPGRGTVAAIEGFLTAEIARAAGIDPSTLDPDQTLLTLGLDSAALVELVQVIERKVGVQLYPTLFFEHQTVAALALHFAERHAEAFVAALAAAACGGDGAGAAAVSGGAGEAERGARAGAGETDMSGGAGDAAPGRGDAGADSKDMLGEAGALRGAEGHAGTVAVSLAGREGADSRDVNSGAGARRGAEEPGYAGAIAVIGAAGRYPGADSLAALWDNLVRGVDSVVEVAGDGAGKAWGGRLAGIDQFDPLLFGISPREAAVMDPQQRLLLETTWEALEDAGYGGRALAGSDCGVFVGATYNNYLEELLAAGVPLGGHMALGNSKAILANRVSYCFDLRGPSVGVDTLCSSSLLAVLLACESLRRGECQVAVAGGVYAVLGAGYYAILRSMGVLSPAGRCQTFDAAADGYVPGEGVGVVVLKPLAQALAHGDPIRAVIRGGASNHDGRSTSLSAPNPRAQVALLQAAYADAQVDPATIGLLEAHGTGTSLGDPIEVAAATEVLGARTRKRQFCAIGSIKTNIGHLEPAAGIAGLTKAILALEQATIPPTLHLRRPNRFVPFVDSPFYVPDRAQPWPNQRHPRRAAVSSFGMGGANAHVIVEAAPETPRRAGSSGPQLAVVSARSPAALARLAERLAAALAGPQSPALADVCFTLARGRAMMTHRLAVVAADTAELAARLAGHAQESMAVESGSIAHVLKDMSGRCVTGSAPARARAVVFAAASGDAGALQRWAEALAAAGLRAMYGLGPCAPARLEQVSEAPAGAVVIDLAALAAAGEPTRALALTIAGAAWAAGAELEADAAWPAEGRGRVRLPTYPFEHQRCWFTPGPTPRPRGGREASAPGAGLSGATGLRGVAPGGLSGETGWRGVTGERAEQAEIAGLVHAPSWREAGPASASAVDGAWLVVGPQVAALAELSRLLAGRGAAVIRAPRLQADVLAAAVQAHGAGLRGVIEGSALAGGAGEAEDAATLAERLRGGAYALLEGLQALLRARGLPPLRVRVLAAGAHWLGEEDGAAGSESAVALGLARTFAREAPQFACRLVDLDPAGMSPRAQAEAAIAELGAGPLELAIRGGRRFVRDLAPVDLQGASPQLGRAKVVLITGGAGGIGLAVAVRLARDGARLGLLGTRPEAAVAPALDRLRAAGAEVVYVQADVADPAATRAAVEQVRRRFGPIEGVIHAAGRLDDGLLVHKEPGAVASVLAPKVFGTWSIDQATREEPLRFFALFGSLAALTGNPGQADYAAANSYQDRFALARAGRGPGRTLVLDWGLWDGVGMGATASGRRAGRGGRALAPERALAVLDAALTRATPTQLAVVELDAEAYAQVRAGLQATIEPPAGPTTGSAARRSGDARTTARRLAELLGELLAVPPSQLDPERPLADTGVDSFVITEAVRALSERYGRPIHHALLLEHPTLAALAEHLTQEYGELPGPSGEGAAEPAAVRPDMADRAGEGGMDARSEVAAESGGWHETAGGPGRVDVRAGAANEAAAEVRVSAADVRSQLSERAGTEAAEAGRADVRAGAANEAAAEVRLIAADVRSNMSERSGTEAAGDARAIAVIGMACRAPGAPDLERFWANLRAGVSAISPPPPGRWPEGALSEPGMCRTGGFLALEHVAGFDAQRFGVADDEAVLLDPHQRVFLEVALEALEHAARAGAGLAGTRTGVYVGVRGGQYHAAFREALARPSGDVAAQRTAVVGSLTNYVAAHVAKQLDLRGPAVAIDTACSSSLLSVHLACQALRAGECELAIAGGVELKLTPHPHQHLSRLRALAADGVPRVFDARASGFVPGEGAGAVVLKPLARALADGDAIYAVIRGSATNSDGRTMGVTTPSITGQIDVLERAYADAAVDPASVGLVEAHGTGTPLGDPIEVKALTQVLRRRTAASGFCGIGSVKSQIGHLDTAAGALGLIKAVLALHRRTLPPTLHCDEPNPRFGFERSPFFVVDRARPWSSPGPRRAAVSAFGFGGTNVHVVLEEFSGAGAQEHVPADMSERSAQILAVSAATPTALAARVEQLAAVLAGSPPPLASLCLSANAGRAHLPVRVAVVGADAAELRAGLLQAEPTSTGAPPRLVMMFPGQGAQAAGMGRELDRAEPAFRAALDRCEQALARLGAGSLRATLAGHPRALVDTAWTQPAVFSVSYATAALWQAWGLRPDAVIGHSLGEYVAACVAGSIAVEDALALVHARGRLMAELPEAGGMLAVEADAEALTELLRPHARDLALAAINAPRRCVIAGRSPALAEVQAALTARGVRTLPLPVSHAFHSPVIEPMLPALAERLARVRFAAPQVPLISNLTGAPVQRLDADHWLRHAREPVRFAAGVAHALSRGPALLLECGPGTTLTTLASLAAAGRPGARTLASLGRGPGERRRLLQAAASLYAAGFDLDWEAVHAGDRARRVALPTYPFERRLAWPERAPSGHVERDRAEETLPRGHEDRPAAPLSPLLDERRALAPGRAFYRKRLDPARDPALGQHVVLGRPILPAVGYLEMFAAAVRDALGSPPRRLCEVTIFQPLVAEAGLEVEVIVAWPDDEPSPRRCEVQVVRAVPDPGRPGGARWVQHAAARAELDGVEWTWPEVPVLEDLAEETWPARFAADATYTPAYAAGSGIDYQPWFRALGAMAAGPAAVIAELALPEPARADAGRYFLHPALLDGALQAMAGIRLQSGGGGDSFLPMFIEAVEIAGPTPTTGRCRVALHTALTPGVEAIRGDVTVVDAGGSPRVAVRGLLLKRVPRAPAGAETFAWRFVDAAPEAEEAAPARTWVVIGPRDPLSDRVVALLRAEGARVIEAAFGPRLRRLTPDRFVVDPEREADMAAVIAAADDPAAALLFTGGLAPEDDALATSELLAASLAGGALALWAVVRASAKLGSGAQGRRLWLLTRRACQLTPEEPAPAPEQAALIAAARAAAQELRLAARVIDVPVLEDMSEAALAELRRPGPDDVIALRPGRRLARRLRPCSLPQAGLVARAGAVYLITGGHRGLGLEVARWLSGQAAVRLAIFGRTAAEDAPELQGLRERGAEVLVIRGDVAREADVLRAREAIVARWGRVDAVIHAAGVIGSPGPLVDREPEAIAAVLAPKVDGARNLDAAFPGGLAAFVLFSSVAASGPGLARGLADYAVANAFLDGLAAHRRARGEAATSVGWPNWAETGMGARGGGEAVQRARGLRSLTTAEGLALLGRCAASDEAHVVVLPVAGDYDPLAPAYPPGEAASRPQVEGATATASATAAASAATGDVFLDFLLDQVAAASGVAPAAIDRRRNFMELGIDSLSLLGFTRAVERRFAVKLYPSAYFEHPTIAALAEHLRSEAARQGAPAAVQAPTPGPRAPRRVRLLHYMNRLIRMRLRASGPLDAAALARAWALLRARHPMLRVKARFSEDGAWATLEEAGPEEQVELRRVDLRGLTAAAQAAAIAEAAALAGERPLLRFQLLTLADEEHLLLIDINHTICDGYSLLLLMGELQRAYASALAGAPLDLPPLAATFWDFLDLRERQRAEPGHAAAQAHWREVFAAPPRGERLPRTDPAGPRRDPTVAVHAVEVDPPRTAALKAAAVRRGVTLYVLMFAALFEQVRRATGSDDLVLGMPTAGRTLPLPGVERIFGCLVNVLPLRVRLRPEDGFAELLARVSEAYVAALRHMDYACEVDYVPTVSFTFPTYGDAATEPSEPGPVRFTLEALTNELGAEGDLDAIFLATLARDEAGAEVLQFKWTYQPSSLAPATIEGLSAGLLARLEALAQE